jgi:HSP20 family molecular chaperone IbpA
MADLPGVGGEDIEVSLSGETLIVMGGREREKEDTRNGLGLSHHHGYVIRLFRLPEDVDRDKGKMAFAGRVLTVSLPKAGPVRKVRKF